MQQNLFQSQALTGVGVTRILSLPSVAARKSPLVIEMGGNDIGDEGENAIADFSNEYVDVHHAKPK